MSVDNSNADARVRIRLVLLSATAILFTLALLAYAFSGIQWAIAPFTLGVLSLLVALGRMTERSLSLFLSDLRGVFADVEQVPQSAQDERNDENMPGFAMLAFKALPRRKIPREIHLPSQRMS